MRSHMRTSRFLSRERGALFALLAIVGPGLLAGLSDDDPAGITTYSRHSRFIVATTQHAAWFPTVQTSDDVSWPPPRSQTRRSARSVRYLRARV